MTAGLDGGFRLAARPGSRASWGEPHLYARDNLAAGRRVFAAAGGVRVVYAPSVCGEVEIRATLCDGLRARLEAAAV